MRGVCVCVCCVPRTNTPTASNAAEQFSVESEDLGRTNGRLLFMATIIVHIIRNNLNK